MLWEKVHKSRGSRMVSTLLAALLVTTLVSPGVAVFAEETTTTPVPESVVTQEPVVEIPQEVAVPDDQPEEAVIEAAPEGKDAEKVTETPAQEPLVEMNPVLAESTSVLAEPVGVPEIDKKSVEISPVTVVASISLVVSANEGGGARDDFPNPVTVGEACELSTIAILWAGQNYEAGTVSASNDADNIYVTFTTTGGWTMGLTHLYVGLVPPASYAPGSFPYQTTHAPAVTSYTYTISLDDLGAVAGDTIYVAAHAEVSNGEQSETAWAGTGQWPGLLFAHVVQECEEPEPADLTIVKFNDLNGNGEMDEGEPVISGIDFTATLGELVLEGTTDDSGTVVFTDLADGTYTIDESLPAGWVATTEIPLDVSLVADQDVTVYVGNREVEEPEDVTKTFRLFYPLAPAGVTFYAEYTMGETSVMVELLGEGPYEAQVDFPVGTEITVSWYAMYGSELVLLGSGEPEILTTDLVNVLTYSASAAGFKFNDLDADGVWDEAESGMGGWTISLFRENASEIPEFELYAVTSTAGDGSYLFGGLLPGTYYVAEEDRAGWFMTVGPQGTVEISNGAAVEGLIFGNAEEPFLPFSLLDLAIEKRAGVEEADPGQLITYTLTYRNVGEGVATDYRIVDDFDERYLAIVDSGGGEVVGGTIVWELAGPLSLQDGPRTLTYTARLIAEMPVGVTNVHNTVVISHPDDPNLTNNTASDVVVVDNPALPFTPDPEDEEPFLPFTGGDSSLLALAILAAATVGLGLKFASRTA